MSAELLCVPFDSEEVKQIAPAPREVILEVIPREGDGTFSCGLAAVLLKHLNALSERLPGEDTSHQVSSMHMKPRHS